MSRTVYVNGRFVPEAEAMVSVFDRGFLFADAVYEVSAVIDGRLVDNAAHLARLRRSLGEIGMAAPRDDAAIEALQQELIRRNGLREGAVYLQVTRGVEDRDFAWSEGLEPTFVMFTQAKPVVDSPLARRGLKVISLPDLRWRRRDIKSTGLLPACLAKMAAKRAGADDAWLVENGAVTEGASNNAYIVTAEGRLVTRPLSRDILPGITRRAVLELCAEHAIPLDERPFTLDEAYAAREAFVTSASALITAVVEIDGRPVGDCRPGPISRRLREIYLELAGALA